MLKRILKIFLIFLASLVLLLLTPLLLLRLGITPRVFDIPPHEESQYKGMVPEEADSGLWVLGNNWFRQNRYHLWELYVEGDAYNRGVAVGKLSRKLIEYQEKVFIEQINQVLPSKGYQQVLLALIAWFNRDLDEYISPELCKEIYGISLSADKQYERYGPAYPRMLNYHAAHDIGHAMQSYYLVGCSSFAGWDKNTADSSLIAGRNFDFYFGDGFARHKIIEFVKPDTGISFAYITWGGMAGAVSGMNTSGLTVTINAGTLKIGTKAATPVTLLAREILQFASDIQGAVKIASSRNIAVSETFLITSANDHKAILIEKKPGSQDIKQPDSSLLLCTNHFQSEKFAGDEDNIINQKENATGYRFRRLGELLDRKPLTPAYAAEVLRDKNGLNDKPIGFGNEKALNQFLAHHSVIFKPEEKIVWVSTEPQVMGAYVAYNLDQIFSSGRKKVNKPIDELSLALPPDSFLFTTTYEKYLYYKSASKKVEQSIKEGIPLRDDSLISKMIKGNSAYFNAYVLAGDYYISRSKPQLAKKYYREALNKVINSEPGRKEIIEKIDACD